MKQDVKGCSVCRPGQEETDHFRLGTKSYVEYDYRSSDTGKLFNGIFLSLREARRSKDKWLGKFLWPSPAEGVIRLSTSQLSVLLDGLDWRLVKPRHVRRPLVAC